MLVSGVQQWFDTSVHSPVLSHGKCHQQTASQYYWLYSLRCAFHARDLFLTPSPYLVIPFIYFTYPLTHLPLTTVILMQFYLQILYSISVCIPQTTAFYPTTTTLSRRASIPTCFYSKSLWFFLNAFLFYVNSGISLPSSLESPPGISTGITLKW